MSRRFAAAHVDEIRTISEDSPDVPDWRPVRHHLGVGAFGVNAWVASAPGELVIERHDEVPGDGGAGGHEELYVVLRGSARFTIGGEPLEAPAGTLVFIGDPAVVREAVATAPDTAVLAVGAARGVAFEPSAWEQRALRDAGAA